MNELLDQILNLKRLSTGDGDVVFEFAREMPTWGWLAVIAGCAAAGLWGYSRLVGARGPRIVLGIARGLLLLLIVVLLLGPQLSKQTERVEKDWVVFLFDRSASMTVEDAPGGTGSRRSREAQLNELVREARPVFDDLRAERNVLLMGFDGASYDLRSDGGAVSLGEATGRRTRLGQALEQTMRRIAGKPVSGIVVVSDGRSSDQVASSTIRQLESRQIPVFVSPLGSAEPIPDAAITRAEWPRAAFVGDLVPVTVDVESLGVEGQPPRGTLRLVDDATGETLAEERLTGDDSEPVTLTARPRNAGDVSWRIVLEPEGPDLTDSNNTRQVRITLADSPIRVAYFDGYPRWEWRYFKNLLLRESSIRSVSLLLSAERRYIQEGEITLDVLPRTAAAWAEFDVIVMGDLRPSMFSEEQLRQIRDHVAQRGGGLLWLGGPASTPGAWRGTPLADLIPFRMGPDGGSTDRGGGPSAWLSPVVMERAPAAERYGVLQLSDTPGEPWPSELTDANLGWSALRWAQQLLPSAMKPTAEVLATAVPVGTTQNPAPLVATMRYGAGRIVYVGTDEIWRYRYGRGETLPERFWIPLVRLLARESLGRGGAPAVMNVTPEIAETEQRVQVSVRLLDQRLMDARPADVKVRVTPMTREGEAIEGALPTEIALQPDSDVTDAVASFAGSWLATEPGQYLIEASDPLLAGMGLAARVEVALPDDELRVPQADHEALRSLAAATGGEVIGVDAITTLPEKLPNRELRLLGTPETETLWDKPLVWALFILLASFEWVVRRLVKLP